MSPERPIREEIDGPRLLQGVNLVLFDLDQVVVESAAEVVEELKEILVEKLGDDVDLDFSASEITGPGQAIIWALDRGYPGESVKSLDKRVWGIDILQRADPIQGAIEIINWLTGVLKKEVGFHTSRPFYAERKTQDWLASRISNFSNDLLAIRKNDEEEKHVFKARNAVNKAKKHGAVLVIEDSPDHARRILELADEEGVEIWVILVPYAKVPVDEDLREHEQLIVLDRNLETQDLWVVYEFLTGEEMPWVAQS